jgi:hypothetical protein
MGAFLYEITSHLLPSSSPGISIVLGGLAGFGRILLGRIGFTLTTHDYERNEQNQGDNKLFHIIISFLQH